MSAREPSRGRIRPGTGRALSGLGVLAVLAGCAGAAVSSARLPGVQGAATTCSLRAVLNIRRGSLIRTEADLVDVARRYGITLTVLQSMGRDTKMIVIRENGPQEVCEDALATLRNDLNIESIER